ncbi:MAG: Glycosyltransferase AglE [Methanoregula sp. PtaU1.Bin051]|nr:MAG: Glycosyltransferase AglE [Methanoregula sp. PtaU1.Bin051]
MSNDESADPLVSICIPTYNRAGMLGDAIASALGQTYSRIEVIVVDNASTDNTAEIVASFTDPRLSYIKNEKNLGLFGNFNRCIEVASGSLIHILHSDDTIEPQFTERSVAFLRRNPAVMLTFGSAKILRDNQVVGELSFADKDIILAPPDGFQLLLSERNFIICPSVIVRRELYDVVGSYPVDLPYSADYALWLKVARSYSIGFVREAVVHYRQGEHSESHRLLFSSPDGYFDMIRIYHSTIRELGDQYNSYRKEMNQALWRFIKDCLYASATRCAQGIDKGSVFPSMYIGAAISGWSMILTSSITDICKKNLKIFGILLFTLLVTTPGLRQVIYKYLNKSKSVTVY